MGAWGALIMGFFGAVFAAMTLSWQWHVSGAALVLPFVVFVVIGVAAAIVIRMPGTGITPSAAEARAITLSTIGEGIGLFVVTNLALNLGRPDLLLPAVALVVGLHFLPMAYAAAFRPFYILGFSLIAAAIAGVMVGGTVSGFAAACALWLAAIMAVARDRRARLVV